MVQKKARKKLIATLVAVGLLVLLIAAVVVVKAMSSSEPPASTETTQQDTPEITDESETTETPAAEPSEPAIDPATVATVTIEPLSLTVSYLKGVGGFDFEVLRSANGTKYVQFSSDRLTGTKCTDDKGQFASIIENPSTDEAATLAKTTTVEGAAYGLSLADATCTTDSELLKQYQDAFSAAFSLLKKM